PTATPCYDDQDRLTQYEGTKYSYTDNGELKSKTTTSAAGNPEVTNYDYDVLGNLKRVTFPDTSRVDYIIDGQNRRIARIATKNGVTSEKRFLYQDGLRIIAELDQTNAVVSRFVYATHANVPDYMVKVNSGVTYRIITDHLGSPRLIVDVANNSVVQK